MMFAGGPGGDPTRTMGGLLNTAANYPLTNGLVGSMSQVGAMPAGVPNYSQIAYQSAGSPHVGPYAQTAGPSGVGVPGVPGSGSSAAGAGIGGLLGTIVQNPNLVKTIGTDLKGLLGPSSPTRPSPTAPDPTMTQMPFDPTAAMPPALSANAPPIASPHATVGQPTADPGAAWPAVGAPAAITAGLLAAPAAAPAGTATVGALMADTGPALASLAPDALAPIVPTASLMAPAAAAPAAAAPAAVAGGGVSLGAMAALALPVAAAIYGPFSQPVTADAKYWNNLGSALTPLSGGSALNSPADAQLAALMDSGSGDIPSWLAQKAAQYGIKPLPVAGMNGFAGAGKPVSSNRTQKV